MGVVVRESDVVVVGAVTAGANVAWQLARRGLSVTILERRRFDEGGAHWHNAVPPWQFDRAEVPRPEPPERVTDGGTTHLFGPDGTHAVTVDGPAWSVDMSALGARLRHAGTDTGVRVIEASTGLEAGLDGDRITSLTVTGSLDGAEATRHELRARLFVDASGHTGALRRHSPVLRRWCPPVPRTELCSAGDHQIEVADTGGATAFLERHGALPGDGVTVVGTDGGFSTRAIRVSEDLSHASVLVGCLADGHSSTAPRMIADVRAAEPWLGASVHSGVGVIPLRRPYARITAPGIALVGDAAAQVFCGHGSGIGTGLMAGTMLAEAVADADDPGDAATLWRYQAEFQHTFGGLLASYDAVRRMSTALGGDGVAAMIRAELLNPKLSTAGLDQREVSPDPRDLPGMAASLTRRPRLAAAVIPWLARSRAAGMWAKRHPATPDDTALTRWDRTMARILTA